MKIVGIDLALRNSACVSLDENNRFLDCIVLTSTADQYDAENLLVYNYNTIFNFINDNESVVMIEGLAFNSTSLAKDIIAGNFWNIRLGLCKEDIEYHIVAPASWRAKVFPPEVKERLKTDRKAAKTAGITGSKLIKEAALSLVPDNIKKEFKKYLTDNKLNAKFMYDLADAYCIAKYGVILYNESR